MKSKKPPIVKICCISSKEEAKLAIESGADVIGLVGPMPSGPGIIDDTLIYKIARVIPKSIDSFLLTSETSAKEIISHYERTKTTSIQIVDKLQEGSYVDIRKQLPNVKLIQVIHVLDQNSVEEAIHVSKFVDYILLDSGNPNATIKELGGTGRTHNWDLSKSIGEAIDIPFFLAGGLNKDNVKDAIEYVQPDGIDLCSGVRTNGRLDKTKLSEFFQAFR